ncbi:MAG: dipicolinate synthase subunit DpsA [Oscillospiraceae bacterium]|nr:dipicolinate synthase subunit DpsA [Oscillospiraceae bacterium]
MRQKLNFWVVGGDQRQVALTRALAEDGHWVHTYALEQGVEPALTESGLSGIEEAHCVILPLPALNGECINTPLSDRQLPFIELLDTLRPGQLLCGGMLPPALLSQVEGRGLTAVDYFAREELAVANAVPSSEGAIQIAMEELPITLHGARVLVIGAGRLGKALCWQLRGLGARVTLCARKYADLAWAQVWGCDTARSDQPDSWLCGYDLVLNTVPALLLDRDVLAQLKPGCLVIDLASKPGGVDFDAARELGVKVIWALGLPGKVAPVTAALAIKSTLYNILSESGA